jgi:hypothetical protein
LSADRTYTITPSASARAEQNFTATAGQTTFTITGGYVVGLVDVFINGARLLPTDYTATNGTTVVLGTGALLNDAVTVLNYTSTIAALPTSRDVIDYTATAAQTTFTVTGGYTVGLLDVYVNGSKLTSAEFTATNGTTFVLTDASVVGNQVQAIRYNASVTGISGSGTANYVPKFTASGTIGNSIIYADSNNIGVNVTPPTWYSNFKGVNLVNGSLITYSTNASLFLTQNAYFNAAGSWTYLNTGTAGQYSIDGTGNHVFYTAVSGTGGNTISTRIASDGIYTAGSDMFIDGGTSNIRFYSTSERMRITSGGNVAIGTTNDSGYKLQVAGSFNANTTISVAAWLAMQNVSGSILGIGGINASEYNTLALYTSATERMRITSGGFTKISNNGSYYNSTGSFHEVSSNVSGSYNTIFRNSASTNPYGLYIYYGSASPNTAAFEFLACTDSTNDKFIIWSNGSAVNRTGSYGTISDIKFKENIVDATPKLDDILNLKVRNFNLKGEDTKQIGFIAQEFEEVFPAMVDVSKEKDSEETYKSIKTSVLVPMLVKAIQELSAKITILENK